MGILATTESDCWSCHQMPEAARIIKTCLSHSQINLCVFVSIYPVLWETQKASELSTGTRAICCLKNEFAYSVFFNRHGTSRPSFRPRVSCTNMDFAEQLSNCGHTSSGLPLPPLLLFWLRRNKINPFTVCRCACV